MSFEKREKLWLTESEPAVHEARALRPGAYDVHLWLPYSESAVRRVTWTGEHDLDISVPVAPQADLIGGVVMARGGEPARGVIVEAQPSELTVEAFCPTDSLGRFLMRRRPGVVDGVQLTVRDATGDAAIADVTEPQPVTWGVLDHEILAEPREGLMVGLRTTDGSSVAGFAVSVAAGRGDAARVRTATGHDGTATVRRVATGEVCVLAVPEGGLMPIEAIASVAADGSGRCDLITQPGAMLIGSVESVGGAPVAMALVSIRCRGSDEASAGSAGLQVSGRALPAAGEQPIVLAARDGRFERALDPRRQYEVTVSAEGHQPAVGNVAAHAEAFSPVRVVLEPLRALRGHVVPHEAASWLADYHAQCTDGGGDIGLWLLPVGETRRLLADRQRIQVGDRGAFELSAIPRGRYRVILGCPGASGVIGECTVGDEPVCEHPDIDLSHLRPGRVSGRVFTGRAGLLVNAVSALAVDAEDLHVGVRSDGAFSFAAPRGSYVLRFAVVDAEGQPVDVCVLPAVQVLAGESSDWTGHLELRGVRVRVVDASTRRAVEGVDLSVDEERGGNFRVHRTDEDGFFVIDPAPVGPFGLSMRREGDGGWQHVAQVDAQSGDSLEVSIVR